jgi:hypothetical protein
MSLILVMFVNMVSKFDANTLRVVSGVVRRCTLFSGFFSFLHVFADALVKLTFHFIFPY